MTADELDKHAARLAVQLADAIKPCVLRIDAEVEQLTSSKDEQRVLRMKYFPEAFRMAAVTVALMAESGDGPQH